jgi:hypothetical protein
MPFIGGSCIGFIPLKKNSSRVEGKLLVAAVATEKNATNHRADAMRSKRNLGDEFE